MIFTSLTFKNDWNEEMSLAAPPALAPYFDNLAVYFKTFQMTTLSWRHVTRPNQDLSLSRSIGREPWEQVGR